jgi:LPXTG-motif cell wall-anchored protein
MKKALAIAGTALLAGLLTMQPVAASAACASYVIWTQDGDSGELKKWSTDGTLLSTLQTGITAGDIGVSSDLTEILAFDDTDLKGYSTTTGALESTHAVSGGSFSGGGAGVGVIAGGKLLTDAEGPGLSAVIVSVDLTTYLATDWADLADADASVPAGLRGGSWDIAGDILQLPDNDILVVATNETVYIDGVILLRINKNTPTQITAVGVVPISDDEVWGAARAGDDIFLATAQGVLYKIGSVPSAASLDPVAKTAIVTGGGSFWGAAGSNDSTEGNAVCTLPDTGLDMTATGAIALSVIAAGGIALLIRRRVAQG